MLFHPICAKSHIICSYLLFVLTKNYSLEIKFPKAQMGRKIYWYYQQWIKWVCVSFKLMFGRLKNFGMPVFTEGHSPEPNRLFFFKTLFKPGGGVKPMVKNCVADFVYFWALFEWSTLVEHCNMIFSAAPTFSLIQIWIENDFSGRW